MVSTSPYHFAGSSVVLAKERGVGRMAREWEFPGSAPCCTGDVREVLGTPWQPQLAFLRSSHWNSALLDFDPSQFYLPFSLFFLLSVG